MNRQIHDQQKLLALPWPEEVPVLAGKDIDGYTETLGRGRKPLRIWINETFGMETPEQLMLRDQFSHVLYDVMRENCDPRDRGLIMFTAVPSTPGYPVTKAPYSPDEVAAWWNEALRRVGYEIE
jgi:hypothetical protein